MLLVSFHRESSGCCGVWPQQVSDRGALAPACLAHPLPCCCHPQSRSRPSSHAQGPSLQTTNSIGLCTRGKTCLQNSMRPYGMHAFVHSSPAGKGGRYGTQCRNSPVFPQPAWFLADERPSAAPPPRSGLLPTPLVQAGEGGGEGGGGGGLVRTVTTVRSRAPSDQAGRRAKLRVTLDRCCG